MAILCVSPNPAIDRTMVVSEFETGRIFRASSVLAAAGGKGINVARAVNMLGGEAVCAGFLGGTSGQIVAELAQNENIPGVWTWIEAETRTCIIIVEPTTGVATVINETGPTVKAEDWVRLQYDVLHHAASASSICFSGSLPPGSPPEAFMILLRELLRGGKQIWVDTSGVWMQAALTVPGIGLKVNNEEAGAILNMEINDVSSALMAAIALQLTGVNPIVVTMGAAGAVLVDGSHRWYAAPPQVRVLDAVGSGDSFLAGLVLAYNSGLRPHEALCHAVAAGAANAMSVGGGQFERGEFEIILGETRYEAL